MPPIPPDELVSGQSYLLRSGTPFDHSAPLVFHTKGSDGLATFLTPHGIALSFDPTRYAFFSVNDPTLPPIPSYRVRTPLPDLPILERAPNLGALRMERATNGIDLETIPDGAEIFVVTGPLPNGSQFRHVYRKPNLTAYFLSVVQAGERLLRNPNNNVVIGTKDALYPGCLITQGKLAYPVGGRYTRRKPKRKARM
jgi:hypothetical protein